MKSNEDEESPPKNQHVTSSKRGIIHIFFWGFLSNSSSPHPSFLWLHWGAFFVFNQINLKVIWCSFCFYAFPHTHTHMYILIIWLIFKPSLLRWTSSQFFCTRKYSICKKVCLQRQILVSGAYKHSTMLFWFKKV